jgi:hypothetical protein
MAHEKTIGSNSLANGGNGSNKTKGSAHLFFVKLLLEQVSIKKKNEALTKSSKNEGTGKSSGCAKKNQLN